MARVVSHNTVDRSPTGPIRCTCITRASKEVSQGLATTRCTRDGRSSCTEEAPRPPAATSPPARSTDAIMRCWAAAHGATRSMLESSACWKRPPAPSSLTEDPLPRVLPLPLPFRRSHNSSYVGIIKRKGGSRGRQVHRSKSIVQGRGLPVGPLDVCAI